jgi:hypothetical protein
MASQNIAWYEVILYGVAEHCTALHDDTHQYMISVNHYDAEFTGGDIWQQGFQVINIY